MKRHTVSCIMAVPRAPSSAASARTVTSGFSVSRARIQSATALVTRRAGEPPAGVPPSLGLLAPSVPNAPPSTATRRTAPLRHAPSRQPPPRLQSDGAGQGTRTMAWRASSKNRQTEAQNDPDATPRRFNFRLTDSRRTDSSPTSAAYPRVGRGCHPWSPESAPFMACSCRQRATVDTVRRFSPTARSRRRRSW